MKTRPLGRSGLEIAPLVFGANVFGWTVDQPTAFRLLDRFVDSGLNAIDTADIYANGESERIVGRLIAGDRRRWVLATKLANPMSAEPNDRGLSARWLKLACEASLKRLGTDWIDLYYLHRDDETTPLEETLAGVGRLLADGKILHWGVSNYRAWRIARIAELARSMGLPPPIACQPPYNAMSRGIETELLPACAQYGVGVVAYSPLARGVLTGKYRPDETPAEGTRAARADKRLLQTEFRPESLALSQRFAEYAAQRGIAAGQLAIAWVLHNRLVSGVIGGPRTLAQWQDYLAARNVVLSAEDEAFVSGLVPAGHASTHGYADPLYPVTGRQPRGAA